MIVDFYIYETDFVGSALVKLYKNLFIFIMKYLFTLNISFEVI